MADPSSGVNANPTPESDPGDKPPRHHPLAVWRWKLHWQVLLGMVIGVGLGGLTAWIAVQAVPDDAADPAGAVASILAGRIDFMLYDLLGDLFLQGLMLIVVPIVMSSLIVSIAGLGARSGFARLGGKTLVYYMTTSLVAILTGLLLVNTIQPGVVDPAQPVLDIERTAEFREQFAGETASLESRTVGKQTSDFLDTFRAMVPRNLIAAAAEGQLLGLIVVSLLIGFFASRLTGAPHDVFLNFWRAVYQVTLHITELVLKFAPIGVAALLAATLAERMAVLSMDGRLLDLGTVIIKFSITVVAALGIHMFIWLPLALIFIAKVKPHRHFHAMAPALMTAFSTASSAGTLPVTLECVEERAGVSNRTSSFVLPLGATVNMDGTALYECVAALFIAQLYGIELSFAQQFFIVIVALLTSIGVAGVPAASLVAIVIILQAVGVPIEGLAFILVFDRLLDMCRTATNVFSDSCGAVLIARSEGETEMLSMDPDEMSRQVNARRARE